MLNTASFTAANKAAVDTLIGMGSKAYEGFEKLTALNLKTLKTGLSEAAETTLAAASVSDAQAALAFPSSLAQPAAERAAAYGREVYAIMATTQSGIESLAGAQTEELKSSFLGAIEAAGKSSPLGSAPGMDMFKTAMAAASKAFDGMHKAGRQVAEAAEANFSAMTPPVPKAAGKAKRG